MKPRRINFDTFGDRAKASSRLRAWMLADQLQLAGHQVTLNGSLDVDIQVFQKRRDAKRLREARGNGARIVFDFDDNYLLDDVGAKDDIVSFMNLADVITVGSRDLLERASRYHEHVVLFENPLDVLSGSGAKQHYHWQGRLSWFGAPENQGTLHALGLRDTVTTVTAGGDIPWSLDTVDTVLQQFDLILLPVEADAWTLAKNANRLLKCAALGIPFLASRTPEHELAIQQLRLPEWLLVEADADWNARIAEVGQRYREVAQLMGRARVRAVERFGIAPVTKRWLQDITNNPPATCLALSQAERDVLATMDVIVLGEDAPDRVLETLKSLRGTDVSFRSVSVISALPLDGGTEALDSDGVSLSFDRYTDFFDIYDDLGHVLGSRSGACTLILQAGVHLKRGFFSDAATFDRAAIALFRGQIQRNDIVLTDLPPTLLDQLMTRPFRPAALLLPNETYQASAGLQPRFGPLALWELLIDLVGDAGVPLRAVSTPVIGVAPDLASRTPLQSYVELLTLRDPVAADNLPSVTNEWERLLFSLHAAVIDAHQDLFQHYQSTIMPRLSIDALHAKGHRTEQQRERERTGRWLAQLRNQRNLEPPRLVRSASGGIYLIDGQFKRHVPTWLVVRALEDLYGATEPANDELAAYEDGPPVGMIANADGHVYLIAGGQRHVVRGLPVPLAASTDQLDKIPVAKGTIDVYRSVERAVKRAQPAQPPARSLASPPLSAPDKNIIPTIASPEPPVAPLDLPVAPPASSSVGVMAAGETTHGGVPGEASPATHNGSGATSAGLRERHAGFPEQPDGRHVVVQHKDTWIEVRNLGDPRRYRPTFEGDPIVNETHRMLLEAPLKAGSVSIDIGIPGSLRREDAAKLYELTYFGQGRVLLVGAGYGLAAVIVALALHEAGRKAEIIIVDPDARAISRSRSTLADCGITEDVTFVQDDPITYCASQHASGKAFGLVFVDHLTAHADIKAVCQCLPVVVEPGGFVLFHDFNDRRNRAATQASGYGIYQGVTEGLASPPFAFYGVFGCSGLYRNAPVATASVMAT